MVSPIATGTYTDPEPGNTEALRTNLGRELGESGNEGSTSPALL